MTTQKITQFLPLLKGKRAPAVDDRAVSEALRLQKKAKSSSNKPSLPLSWFQIDRPIDVAASHIPGVIHAVLSSGKLGDDAIAALYKLFFDELGDRERWDEWLSSAARTLWFGPPFSRESQLHVVRKVRGMPDVLSSFATALSWEVSDMVQRQLPRDRDHARGPSSDSKFPLISYNSCLAYALRDSADVVPSRDDGPSREFTANAPTCFVLCGAPRRIVLLRKGVPAGTRGSGYEYVLKPDRVLTLGDDWTAHFDWCVPKGDAATTGSVLLVFRALTDRYDTHRRKSGGAGAATLESFVARASAKPATVAGDDQPPPPDGEIDLYFD